jgi:hypothetical protein
MAASISAARISAERVSFDRLGLGCKVAELSKDPSSGAGTPAIIVDIKHNVYDVCQAIWESGVSDRPGIA